MSKTTTQINFNVSLEDAKTISKIARRATAMASRHDFDYPIMESIMDVTACHANGNPLRLEEFLATDDFNFAHDAFGIRKYINRSTGELEDFFSPRFSKPTDAKP